MLTLKDYPGRGIPDATYELNIEFHDVPGFPMFICWRADDQHGKPVKVLIGFLNVVAARINAVLISERAALQDAANAADKPGDSEVVLLAPAAFARVA